MFRWMDDHFVFRVYLEFILMFIEEIFVVAKL